MTCLLRSTGCYPWKKLFQSNLGRNVVYQDGSGVHDTHGKPKEGGDHLAVRGALCLRFC